VVKQNAPGTLVKYNIIPNKVVGEILIIVVLARLRKEFGDKPDGYDVQASCLKAS